MHPSARENAALFFGTYGPVFGGRGQVLEIGSQDINGNLRDLCPEGMTFTGVDFVAGKGVDLVLEDPYVLPVPDASVDMVVSSSCFEHSQLFWLLFLEALRILKPHGLFYVNAPSNGYFHRHPVDCWRFYPDSGEALVEWGRRSGYRPVLLESLISDRIEAPWNDFVAVFLKDEAERTRFPDRLIDRHWGYCNGRADTDPPDAVRRFSLRVPPRPPKHKKDKKRWWRMGR